MISTARCAVFADVDDELDAPHANSCVPVDKAKLFVVLKVNGVTLDSFEVKNLF